MGVRCHLCAPAPRVSAERLAAPQIRHQRRPLAHIASLKVDGHIVRGRGIAVQQHRCSRAADLKEEQDK